MYDFSIVRQAFALLAAFAFASCAFALDPGRALTQSRLTSWTHESGLPQNTVDAIVQTRDGYLWMGTEEGLVRFDGVRFVVSDRQNAPGLRSSFISSLFEAPDGTLWIGTYGGGIARLRHGVIEPFHPELLGTDRIREFHRRPDGSIYVGTAGGGLLRIDGDSVTRFTTRDGLPTDRIWAVEEDGHGALWIATHGGGLVLWNNDRAQKIITAANGLPNDYPRALLRAPDGALWIGTDGGGLAIVRDGSVVRTISTRDGMPSDLIRTLHLDRDGALWIGTDEGLVRWRDEKIEVLGAAQGLPNPTIRTVFDDREGSVWIGTTGGLVRLRDTRFLSFTEKEGLSADGVRAILEDRDKRVWIGMEGGGLCRVFPAPVHCLTKANGLPNDTVYALAESRDGTIWAGTDGGGVVRLRGEKIVDVVDVSRGLPNNRVRALVEKPNGDFWVSTTTGLGLVHEGRATRVSALEDRQIRPLLALKDGSLLVGTDGAGLWRVAPDGSATMAAKAGAGLESDRIFSLAADPAGDAVWIGTSGGGLARLDLRTGAVESLVRRDGLFDDVVFQVVDGGPTSDLWMTSNRGLYRVPRERVLAAMNGAKVDLGGTVYGSSDGMPSSECNGAFPGAIRASDGRIWVATAGGVAVADPRVTTRNLVPPPVHVEEVLLDGTIARDAEIHVRPGTQRIELRYTALALRAPEHVHFRYKLDGYDRDWVDAGTNRVATYTKLGPGDYSFRVIAENEDGTPSEREARLTFTVEPRWFETWWARLLGLALLAASVWGIVRLRLSAAHRRHAELEAIVAERTRSLRAERERAEAASRAKSDFLANMSHELRTPLNAVLGFVQLMERRPDRDPADREHLGIITRSGEHLLGLINDVLSLSKIESGLATRTDAPFDFARLLRGLGELLQAKARSKKLTVRVEVDDSADVIVSGDEGKLRQIVLNLLGNAVKFTDRGNVVLRARWADGRGVVEVEDSGPGIEEHELSVLFEAFAQAETGRRANEGAGLGLAISRSLARIHGGDITIHSRPGEGTIVHVEVALPLASEPVVRDRGRRAGRVKGLAAGEHAPLVLVVDDSAEARRLLREMLASVGCRVMEASDGDEAIALWRQEKPDLIFMDLRMQGMSGLDATARIREQQRALAEKPATRIVVLSASAFDHERTEAIERGADAFLAKPFREDAVFSQLENLLGTRFAREAGVDPQSATVRSGLSPESVAALPLELRQRLAAAAAGGESNLLQTLAEEAAAFDPRAAAELATLARAYRFDEIEAALAAITPAGLSS